MKGIKTVAYISNWMAFELPAYKTSTHYPFNTFVPDKGKTFCNLSIMKILIFVYNYNVAMTTQKTFY